MRDQSRVNRFIGKTVLIIGATGGLGSAIAQAFAAEGAALALAGRRELPQMAPAGLGMVTQHRVDITDETSLAALRDEVVAAHGRLDVVVNAAGSDVRKPFEAHSLEDFRRTLEVNLLGAMLITRTFIPVLDNGIIVHLGGFADGRLAFPFYSADAASRAGLRAFTEAVNRELVLEHRPVVVSFFSPSPADTVAERPFHPLWQQMGTKIVPPARVAAELVEAVRRREKVHLMGGLPTRLFAALNAISPGLADRLLLKQYGEVLSRFFAERGSAEPGPNGKPAFWRSLGIFLVVFSFIAYGLLLAIPFVPLSTPAKLVLSPLLVGLGEVTFWVGGALLGKEVITRFRRYLNPCSWFSKKADG